jgi:hypothetical protein
VGPYYDAPNSRYTPAAGKYMIVSQIYCNAGVVDQNDYIIYLYENGAAICDTIYRSSGTGALSMVLNVLVDANGTDFYEIYFQGNGAGNKTIEGNAANTFFQAVKVA